MLKAKAKWKKNSSKCWTVSIWIITTWKLTGDIEKITYTENCLLRPLIDVDGKNGWLYFYRCKKLGLFYNKVCSFFSRSFQ